MPRSYGAQLNGGDGSVVGAIAHFGTVRCNGAELRLEEPSAEL